MSKSNLPSRPNLEHLRSQAKRLLAELHDGDDAAAHTFIEHLPAAKKLTPAQVRSAGYRLADAQSAIARKSGFAAWPALAHHVAELRALEGAWSFVSLEVDGAAMPMSAIESSRMLIDGDRFRMESHDSTYEGIFTIDVEAKPPRIDIDFVEGPEAGNRCEGIYTLDGDDLVFCLGLVGSSRPERFATAPGSGHAFERLRRASAARPANVTGGTPQPKPAVAPTAPVDESAFALRMTPLLERLQGAWAPVQLVNNGQAMAEKMISHGSRTMVGNETKVVFGGQTMIHALVRIDETQSPIAIDYLYLKTNSVVLGIMKIEDDVVTFCMAATGDPRPTAFASDKGSKRTLSAWRRT